MTKQGESNYRTEIARVEDHTDPSRVAQASLLFVEGCDRIYSDDEDLGFPRCLLSRAGNELAVSFRAERVILRKPEIELLWIRFQAWKVRKDSTITFRRYFEDANHWGCWGDIVIKEVVAMLMFTASALAEIDAKKSMDPLFRVISLLPRTLYFGPWQDTPGYSAGFRVSEGALVFEKQGRMQVIPGAEMAMIWSWFTEWWHMPQPEGRDLKAFVDLRTNKGGERAFYAFELACLLQEAEVRVAFPSDSLS